MTDDRTSDENLSVLEAHLAGTLKPVTPPSGLFERLRDRIQIPSRREIRLRLNDWGRLLFVLGGVISGMLLIITLARAFYHLAARKAAM
jgi:hypothetical protein